MIIKNIYYRSLAAFIFFTRLPFWRIANVPKEYYERVVPLWSMTGWLTGSVMAATFCIATYFFPTNVCIIMAIISRLLITGALHEDGFADFCDGFGGGTSRERVLEIMKDSHIGSYGVIGLAVYYILIFSLISNLPESIIPHAFITADTYSKYLCSHIINVLPYARKESEAKNKLVYHRMTVCDILISTFFGLLSFIFFIHSTSLIIPMAASALIILMLFRMMKHRIKGYTGDCCGAAFIITETVFYIALVAACQYDMI
ncbi:MAG: adenosylcobinamide-GDP ribazoletransferase [Bacteroides sp.]|nr:adenosylcobinamide-GDP ribazoletransferase [Roseburia sp.]MCM1345575.1 adenosylcobinamide-GDP ribazoletransferase [Bacteroides sp.]MCM1421270.1 adenosylcobinamide-GDP ribazoletransferase [Bacteroides sp.]